jgi:uncharacterized Ntn-hydrolase superfamily protein
MIAGCQDTGRFGVVVSTYTPAVGRTICVCSPGRGITVVQALGSAELLVRAGKMLDVNNDAAWIIDALSLSDSHPELRRLRPSPNVQFTPSSRPFCCYSQ